MVDGLTAMAAALAIAIPALATAWAEKDLGSAVVGAMAEKEGLFGKGLILTVLPETSVIFGFVIAMLILMGA